MPCIDRAGEDITRQARVVRQGDIHDAVIVLVVDVADKSRGAVHDHVDADAVGHLGIRRDPVAIGVGVQRGLNEDAGIGFNVCVRQVDQRIVGADQHRRAPHILKVGVVCLTRLGDPGFRVFARGIVFGRQLLRGSDGGVLHIEDALGVGDLRAAAHNIGDVHHDRVAEAGNRGTDIFRYDVVLVREGQRIDGCADGELRAAGGFPDGVRVISGVVRAQDVQLAEVRDDGTVLRGFVRRAVQEVAAAAVRI